MYFDFEDRYDDYQPVGGTLRRWDGVLISVGVHVVFVVVLLFAPVLPISTLSVMLLSCVFMIVLFFIGREVRVNCYFPLQTGIAASYSYRLLSRSRAICR